MAGEQGPAGNHGCSYCVYGGKEGPTRVGMVIRTTMAGCLFQVVLKLGLQLGLLRAVMRLRGYLGDETAVLSRLVGVVVVEDVIPVKSAMGSE